MFVVTVLSVFPTPGRGLLSSDVSPVDFRRELGPNLGPGLFVAESFSNNPVNRLNFVLDV